MPPPIGQTAPRGNPCPSGRRAPKDLHATNPTSHPPNSDQISPTLTPYICQRETEPKGWSNHRRPTESCRAATCSTGDSAPWRIDDRLRKQGFSPSPASRLASLRIQHTLGRETRPKRSGECAPTALTLRGRDTDLGPRAYV